MKFIFRILVKASVWSFLAPGAERATEGGRRRSAQAEGLIHARADVNDALGVSQPPRSSRHGQILAPEEYCPAPPRGAGGTQTLTAPPSACKIKATKGQYMITTRSQFAVLPPGLDMNNQHG